MISRRLVIAAMILLQEHRFADARPAASALLKRSPDDAEALGMLADAALERRS